MDICADNRLVIKLLTTTNSSTQGIDIGLLIEYTYSQLATIQKSYKEVKLCHNNYVLAQTAIALIALVPLQNVSVPLGVIAAAIAKTKTKP